MKLSTLVVAGLLLLVGVRSVQGQPEIQGEVTIRGLLIRDKDNYVVQVGANYANFVLTALSREETRLLQPLVGRGIRVKGHLRSDANSSPPNLLLERIEFTGDADGHFDHKVEGSVQVRGLLTKDVWFGIPCRGSGESKPDAFLLHQVPRLMFSVLHFTGDGAKKAESLYGRNVTIKGKLQSHALGTRGQTFTYVVEDVQVDGR